MVELDRRKPLPENHVFEAHEPYAEDPDKNYHLSVFRGEADVFIGFVDPDKTILNWINIDADQCEAFGLALVEAAKALQQAR